jgi:hypothetical protein
MSQGYDEYGDDGDQGQQQGTGPQSNQDFAWRRQQEKAVRDAERERDRAKRETAFLRAGIDPESQGIAAYFVKGYDGDLDPTKIREAAIAAGVMQPPQPTPEQVQQQVDLAAGQRMSAAAIAQTGALDIDAQRRQALEDAYKAGGMEGLTAAMAAMGVAQTQY